MVPRPSGHLRKKHRLCQTVSQTSGASARDSQAVGDDAKTVLEPEGDSQTVTQTVGASAGDSQTVYDVGKTSGRRQETRTRCQTIYMTVGAQAGKSQTVFDGAKTVRAPA
ncbi:hypothetical protein DPMN_043820 [Dreissena polymorpha]|uniref:Uncharacterized protein n=1 Tax=Dreissena polymorpha TaxID=45954 RepID=A0A9D4D4R1_DREPO|nr:hypothetical protein DPMN_043820 [Dreissena polymorpha]